MPKIISREAFHRLIGMRKKHKIILIVGVCIGVIGAGVPAFIRARNTSAYASCDCYLRQLDGAIQEWALEHHKTTNDAPRWDDIVPYLAHGEIPKCPQGGTYTLRRCVDGPICSIPGHELPTAPQ